MVSVCHFVSGIPIFFRPNDVKTPKEASAEVGQPLPVHSFVSSYSHEFAMQKKTRIYAKHHLGAGFMLSLRKSHGKSHHPKITTLMSKPPSSSVHGQSAIVNLPTPQKYPPKTMRPRPFLGRCLNGWWLVSLETVGFQQEPTNQSENLSETPLDRILSEPRISFFPKKNLSAQNSPNNSSTGFAIIT